MTGTLHTFGDLKAEFDRWTFEMPGWQVELVEGDSVGLGWAERHMLMITAEVPDSRGSGRMIKFRSLTDLPMPIPSDLVGVRLRHAIHDAMLHEADEWLQRDGVLVFDPHARR